MLVLIVVKHDKDSSSKWVISGSLVYDITDFIECHPGGQVILRACGGSIDPYWKLFSIHQKPEVRQVLDTYYIGDIDDRDLDDDGKINWLVPHVTLLRMPYQHWGAGTVKLLTSLRARGMSYAAIAQHLGRSIASVETKLWHLKRQSKPDGDIFAASRGPARPCRPWTEIELSKLEKLRASGASMRVAAVTIGRALSSVRFRWLNMCRRGKARPAFYCWTSEEDARLRALVQECLSRKAIGAKLGNRSASQVQDRVKRLGLTKPRTTRRLWTSQEYSTLKASIRAGVPHKQLSAHLPGRSTRACEEAVAKVKHGEVRIINASEPG